MIKYLLFGFALWGLLFLAGCDESPMMVKITMVYPNGKTKVDFGYNLQVNANGTWYYQIPRDATWHTFRGIIVCEPLYVDEWKEVIASYTAEAMPVVASHTEIASESVIASETGIASQ